MTMKMKVLWILLSLLLAAGMVKLMTAQTEAPTLTPEQKNSLYAAQHKLDVLEKEMIDLTAQLLQSPGGQRLTALQKVQPELRNQLEAAKQKAFSETKVDEKKYELNLDSMTFVAKPAVASNAPPNPKASDRK